MEISVTHLRESSSRTHQRSLSSASAVQSPADPQSQAAFRADQKLLEFYGIEELMPETWNEPAGQFIATAQSPNSAVQTVAASPPTIARNYFDEEDVDPLGIKSSILGRLSSKAQESAKLKKLRNQVLLTSREFDPKKFLLEIHKNTSYKDMLVGYKNLQNAVDKRQETLKSLVKTNFDRFVGAKATVEAVYKELKVKNLGSAGYGTDDFNKELQSVFSKTNSLYGPIIERKNKVDKIRATMNVLDRYKFFFNLPASLEESFKKGRFEQAVRDYRKGKSVLNMVKNNSGGTAASPGRPRKDSSVIQQNSNDGLVKVFEKVWEEVERTVALLREKLFIMLENMEISTELHEKCINFLNELDSPVDPVWHFINANHSFILKLLKTSYETFGKSMENCLKQYTDMTVDHVHVSSVTSLDDLTVEQHSVINRHNAIQLYKFRKAVLCPNFKEFETIFGKDVETKAWRSFVSLFNQYTEIVGSYLPDFWNICRSFIDGKFSKAGYKRTKTAVPQVDAEQAEKCVKMFSDILEHYCSNLQFSVSFILSLNFEEWIPSLYLKESQIQMSADQQQVLRSFYASLRNHSVHAFYYLPKLVININDCFNTLSKSLKPVNSAAVDTSMVMELTLLKSTLDSVQKGFTDFLCARWIKEASIMYTQEDGKSKNDRLLSEKSEKRGSIVVKLINKMQKLAMRGLFQVVAMIEFPTLGNDEDFSSKKFIVPAKYMSSAVNAFSDSISVFLDGLYLMAFHSTAWNEWINVHSGHYPKPNEYSDVKYLILLENIDVCRYNLIPAWQKMFQDLFKSSLDHDMQNINEVSLKLDELIFDEYVKIKRSKLQEIVSRGCLFSGFDWKRTNAPLDLHPFVNESLMFLVETHAEIKEWLTTDWEQTPATMKADEKRMSLTQRIFVTLLLTVVQCFQDAFCRVDGMSPYGGMQALIDIRALMEIVSTYKDFVPNLASIERQIFTIICENVSLYLAVTKNTDITDISAWIDRQNELMDGVVSNWKLAGEVGLRCLKNE